MNRRTLINDCIYITGIVLVFSLCRIACGQQRYALHCSARLQSASMDSLEKFVGIVEATNHNDGYRVGALLRHVGLGVGFAWCAATQVTAFDTARGAEPLPIARTAMANGIYTDAARRGTRAGVRVVRAGDLFIWQHAGTSAGHIARVVKTNGTAMVTIEGNTTSGARGDQRDGGGCYLRVREVGNLGTMQWRGCVGWVN